MEQPSPPAAGVTATVDLLQAAADLGVHLLPCGIRQNGGDPVSDYFKPRSTGAEVEGVRVEEVFFRGRKLQGATLALPDGYRGSYAETTHAGLQLPRWLCPFQAPQHFKNLLVVPFFMKIIVLMSWSIWTVRNDWIFNDVGPTVTACRAKYILEFAMVIHRANLSYFPQIKEWLDSIS
ncbi:uncharacterized protein LOC133918434 isoform X1 [Phragmites australis]|uniref:uncharacterized protein LOC133918434 isoform X1 n=1 Tax=Phragmites australis TaxID=29695 RepID=UPI002D79A644|nr:uncharacterized protein LOC133918434 isoform X1 [Phragmites australis]